MSNPGRWMKAEIKQDIRSAQNVSAAWGPATSSRFHVRSERSPLHDVRQHAISRRPVHGTRTLTRICFLTDEHDKRGDGNHRWWSQTGSNRRPPACKAGALPTELWPRARWLANRSSLPRLRPHGLRRATFPHCVSEGWWAWEDLNFRPHAYQARALTN